MASQHETYAEVPVRGGLLRGMVHRPLATGGRRLPALMMWHGFTGTRIEPHRLFVHAARRFAAAGIITARFDFMGSGESDGEYDETTPETQVEDALAVLRWMQVQPDVDRTRLGLLGLSLGGLVATCAAARSGQVAALALWAATAHFEVRMRERITPEAQAQLDAQGFADLGGNRIGRAFVEAGLRINPLNEAAGYQGHALVVHGTDDPVVPVGEAREYCEALRHCNPRLHTIAGADHTFNRVAWADELIGITGEWLAGNL